MPAEGLDMTPAPQGGDAEPAGARQIARMRLVLALAMLSAVAVEPWGLPGMDPALWPLFAAYAGYSLAVGLATERGHAWTRSKWLHRADLPWHALMVGATGGGGSVLFLLFFLPILGASVRWGRTEGRAMVLAAGVGFVAAAWAAPAPLDATRLVLRCGFLLVLGQLCAHWGAAQLELQRRLALLRDVSQLSNPRFGAEATLQAVLERIRVFFGARSCLLVLRAPDRPAAWMRSARATARPGGRGAEPVGAAITDVLLPFAPEQLIVHRSRWRGWPARTLTHSPSSTPSTGPGQRQRAWAAGAPTVQLQAHELAELLEADSLVSVPVALRQGRGRLHVCRSGPPLKPGDALFLAQVVAQAFAVIDQIDLLDRMASEAAARERQRFALDLHDTAVQPYIGLRMALAAVRQKAAPGDPLAADLERLEAMAGQASDELRRYAHSVRTPAGSPSALLAELRRQAAQVRAFYGVDIAVQVDGELRLGDRLCAEVLQVVREGLANICKHTLAERGAVQLRCKGGWLGICIANEGTPARQAEPFMPRSICERASALGGHARVQQEPGGRTAVHIHIPV